MLSKIEETLTGIYEELKMMNAVLKKCDSDDIWLDHRTTKHMLMREDRQLRRYVEAGQLVKKKVGRSCMYLASSVYKILGGSQPILVKT